MAILHCFKFIFKLYLSFVYQFHLWVVYVFSLFAIVWWESWTSFHSLHMSPCSQRGIFSSCTFLYYIFYELCVLCLSWSLCSLLFVSFDGLTKWWIKTRSTKPTDSSVKGVTVKTLHIPESPRLPCAERSTRQTTAQPNQDQVALASRSSISPRSMVLLCSVWILHAPLPQPNSFTACQPPKTCWFRCAAQQVSSYTNTWVLRSCVLLKVAVKRHLKRHSQGKKKSA